MSDDVAKEIKKDETPVTPPASTNADDAAFGGFAMCPRCNFDTRLAVTVVDEEDKKEYIRCLMAETPFTKIYTLFDKAFSIKFRELTTDEADKIITIIKELVNDPLFVIKATQIKVLFTCSGYKRSGEWTIIDREQVMALTNPEEALALYKKYFAKFPDTVSGSITNLYNIFGNQVVMIANGSLDKSF
jgi:hypothetical protein